jgi:hypothetical protein
VVRRRSTTGFGYLGSDGDGGPRGAVERSRQGIVGVSRREARVLIQRRMHRLAAESAAVVELGSEFVARRKNRSERMTEGPHKSANCSWNARRGADRLWLASGSRRAVGQATIGLRGAEAKRARMALKRPRRLILFYSFYFLFLFLSIFKPNLNSSLIQTFVDLHL